MWWSIDMGRGAREGGGGEERVAAHKCRVHLVLGCVRYACARATLRHGLRMQQWR